MLFVKDSATISQLFDSGQILGGIFLGIFADFAFQGRKFI